MKLVLLVICGFLAVYTDAADGVAFSQSSEVKVDASVETDSQALEDDSAEDVATPPPSSDVTVLSANAHKPVEAPAAPAPGSTTAATKTGLSGIPFPLNIILSTFGKDAFRAIDIETVCDTVQLVDWKKYQQLLDAEDYVGFKDRIVNDQILTGTAEAFKEATTTYVNKMMTTISKSMKFDSLESLQLVLMEFLKFLPLDVGGYQKSIKQNNVKNIVELMALDKKGQKEAVENLKSNIDKLLEVIAAVKAQNSGDALKKNLASGYFKTTIAT